MWVFFCGCCLGGVGCWVWLVLVLCLLCWGGWCGGLVVLGVLVGVILAVVGLLLVSRRGSSGVVLRLGEALREACS
ncbi:hypothetical protein RA269_27585, partial [Pseudomonas syringae pv. tagetis]